MSNSSQVIEELHLGKIFPWRNFFPTFVKKPLLSLVHGQLNLTLLRCLVLRQYNQFYEKRIQMIYILNTDYVEILFDYI